MPPAPPTALGPLPASLEEAVATWLKAQDRLSGVNVWYGTVSRVADPQVVLNVVGDAAANNLEGKTFAGYLTLQLTVLCSGVARCHQILHAARGLFEPLSPTFAWGDEWHAGATTGNRVGDPFEWTPSQPGQTAPAGVLARAFRVMMYATRQYQ